MRPHWAKLFPAIFYLFSHTTSDVDEKFSLIREVGTLLHNTALLETLRLGSHEVRTNNTTNQEINEISLRTYGVTMKGARGLSDVIYNILLPLLNETSGFKDQEQEILSIRRHFNYNVTAELEKNGISSTSTFYVETEFNHTLPSSLLMSFSNRTELSSFGADEKFGESWVQMNSKTAYGTNSTQPDVENKGQKDVFVPPATMLAAPFNHLTAGAYITTDHYKALWKSSDAGNLNFSKDKKLASFFELEQSYPLYESDHYSAVRIPLNEGKQILSLVLPKISIHEINLLRSGLDNSARNSTQNSNMKKRRIQLPTLDITGWNRATRLDLIEVLKSQICQEVKYCIGPVAQAVYLKFKPDSLEVSSATGVTVKKEQMSMEELLAFMNESSELNLGWGSTKGGGSTKGWASQSGYGFTQVSGSTQEKLDSSSEHKSDEDLDIKSESDESPETESEYSDEARSIVEKKRGRNIRQTSHEDILRFDKPFLWFLMDDGTEVYSGIVDSIHKQEDSDNPINHSFSWLKVIEKVALWSGLD